MARNLMVLYKRNKGEMSGVILPNITCLSRLEKYKVGPLPWVGAERLLREKPQDVPAQTSTYTRCANQTTELSYLHK